MNLKKLIYLFTLMSFASSNLFAQDQFQFQDFTKSINPYGFGYKKAESTDAAAVSRSLTAEDSPCFGIKNPKTARDTYLCFELITICRNGNYNDVSKDIKGNSFGFNKEHCNDDYTHINEEHVRTLMNSSPGQDVGCCPNGICKLGDDDNTCNLVDKSILGLSDTSKNADLFTVLSSITRSSNPADKSINRLDKHSCEKCWKAAHNAINDSNNTKSYDKDLESLSRKLKGSSSLEKNILKNRSLIMSEYYSGFAKKFIDKSTRNLESVSMEDSIDLVGKVILFREKLSSKSSELGSFQDASNQETKTFNSLNKNLSKLSVKCINDDLLNEIRSCAESNISDEQISKELSQFNIDTNNILQKHFYYLNRTLSQNKEENNENSTIELIRNASINLIEDPKNKDKYNKVINSCSKFDSGEMEYDLIKSIEFLIGESSTSVMKRSDESMKEIIDVLSNEIKQNPKYSFLFYDHSLYCNALRSKDVGSLTELFDKNLEPSLESIVESGKSLCPSRKSLVEAYCSNKPNSLTSKEYNKLSEGEKVVANTFMCKGELSILDPTPSARSGLSEHLMGAMTENPSSTQRRISSRGGNSGGGISQRNNALSGRQILEGLIGNSNVTKSSNSLESRANETLDEPRQTVPNPMNNFSDSSFSNSIVDKIDNMKRNLTSSNSNIDGANSSSFISDQNIQQAITSNPKIEDKINKVKDLIQDSKEQGELSGVENPNQAIFDYLKDEKSSEAQELANSQNSELKAELAQLKKQINEEKQIADKKQSVDSSNKELQAANARIKKLEGIVDQMRNPSQGILSNTSPVNNGDGNVEFIPVGGSDSSRKSSSFNGVGRDVASVQTPIVNLIPKTVNDNLESIISSDKGIVLLKDEMLYITIDETQYPLNVEEVVLTSGVVSGIKVQKGNSGSVVLPISSFKGKSKEAVQKYIAKEGAKLLKSEVIIQKEAQAAVKTATTAYLDFLCSIHPEKAECK